MAPFKYEPFVNPYVGSIIDLMGKGDEAKAQALLRVGEIEAQAARQRGQAWSGAIQSVGNIASKGIKDWQDQKITDEDRKYLLEERARLDLQHERDEGARDLYGSIRSASNVHGIKSVPLPVEDVETTLPATFGLTDKYGGTTAVDVPAETQQTLSGTYGVPTITNPYKELDKSGIQSLDLWDIEAVRKSFAEQGFGPEGEQYIGWMDDSNKRMEAHHEDALMMAGDAAKKIIQIPGYSAMLNATESLMEKFEKNAVFAAPDLASFRSSLDNIKGMDPSLQEDALKGLLIQMVPGGEDSTVLRTSERLVGDTTGNVLAEGGQEPLTQADSVPKDFYLPGIGNVLGEFRPGVGGQPGSYWYGGEDVSDRVMKSIPASTNANTPKRILLWNLKTNERRYAYENSQELQDLVETGNWIPGLDYDDQASYDADIKLAEEQRYEQHTFANNQLAKLDILMPQVTDEKGEPIEGEYKASSGTRWIFGKSRLLSHMALGGTEIGEAREILDFLKSNKILETINRMKSQSKTGATGFGQLSEAELLVLQQASTILSGGATQEQAIQALVNMRRIFDRASRLTAPQGEESGIPGMTIYLSNR